MATKSEREWQDAAVRAIVDGREDQGNSAMLVTQYLPQRLRRNLARGLEARFLELWRDRRSGYGDDNTKESRDLLISDTRQAYALGIIYYLPTWAIDHTDHVGDGSVCLDCNMVVYR